MSHLPLSFRKCAGKAPNSGFPAYLFWAQEGMLPPEECLGPTGTGSGGSLSAKQSIQEIDGRGVCPEGGYACCSSLALIYSPLLGIHHPLTAHHKLRTGGCTACGLPGQPLAGVSDASVRDTGKMETGRGRFQNMMSPCELIIQT